jgi:hypothetical protein
MEFVAMPARDTEQFLDIYNQFAERGAQKLARFGIDGMTPFKEARAIAAHMNTQGNASCAGDLP